MSQFGADEVGDSERKEFIARYDMQKDRVFDNRHMFELYCQDDVTVLG